MKIRIGNGYDVHRLEKGEDLILGGIKIEHYKGTIAHSDGDVLLHAICDSLLGAANMGDIGLHFPDSSKEYKNIDSKLLLRKTHELIKSHNWNIGNIDTIICLQTPKIQKFIPEMKIAISEALEITEDLISIKATTTEKLGFIGREEGISAYATTLLHQ